MKRRVPPLSTRRSAANHSSIPDIRINQEQDNLFSSLNQTFTLIVVCFLLVLFAAIIQYYLFRNVQLIIQLEGIVNDSKDLLNITQAYEQLSNKAIPNGYAPLDANKKIPEENFQTQLFSDTIFFGCWNAESNFPFLFSGAGEQYFLYIVCETGSTLLNGINEWVPFDIVYFIGDPFGWFQFQGRKNSLIDSGPISQPMISSLIKKKEGPEMSLKSISSFDSNMRIVETPSNIDIIYKAFERPPLIVRNIGNGSEIPIYKNSSDTPDPGPPLQRITEIPLKSLIAGTDIGCPPTGPNPCQTDNLNIFTAENEVVIDTKPSLFPKPTVLTLIVVFNRFRGDNPNPIQNIVFDDIEFGAVDIGKGFVRLFTLTPIEIFVFNTDIAAAIEDDEWVNDKAILTILLSFLPGQDPDFILQRLPAGNPNGFISVTVTAARIENTNSLGSAYGYKSFRGTIPSDFIEVDIYRIPRGGSANGRIGLSVDILYNYDTS